MNWPKATLVNDILERAIKTFMQAFMAALIVTGCQVDKTAVTAALAAGLSAVWNYLRAL